MSYEQLIQLAIAREDNLLELAMPFAWDEPALQEFNPRHQLAKPESYVVSDV